MITDHRGIALGSAQINIRALALIDQNLDGAILDGNPVDGLLCQLSYCIRKFSAADGLSWVLSSMDIAAAF